MKDGRHRQPAVDETPHTVPKDAAILAPPRQRAMPEASHLEPKEKQRRLVHGHSVIADVSTHHCLHPLAHFQDGFMHAPRKLGFHFVQLRLQPFTYGPPKNRIHSVASVLHADVRKAKKVERLRFPVSASLPVVDRERTNLQQSRFLGMQFPVELLHSFREFGPKLIGMRLTLRHCFSEQLRMTRGRCGSLIHVRLTFAFTTPRRFNRRTGESK
jgi:hypothetical protein